MVRWVIGIIILIPVVVIWAFFLTGHWQSFKVISRSMEPTLLVDDYLIMRKQHNFPTLEGQVVVLKDPEGGAFPIVKRVVAGAFSVVKIRNGLVYLDTSKTPIPGERIAHVGNKHWTLKENEIFVMGDNRNNSEDSTDFGPLDRSDIIGVITWRYWPSSRMGSIQ